MFASAFFGLIMVIAAFNFFDSQKEKMLKRELDKLRLQYELMDKSLNQISAVLENIKDRDDNIYRVIFEAEPIPNSIRKAGIGCVNRYKDLEGYDNSEILLSTVKKVDQISKQLYIQSKSFDEVIEMAQRKSDMMASIPAIQPVKNKELKRIASGYGRRIDPYYKKPKFHYGVDFSAPKGTPIMSTANGTVVAASYTRGNGNYVKVKHNKTYTTQYLHMTRFAKGIRKGVYVEQGQTIGYIGSTGLATGPHVCYRFWKNGKQTNHRAEKFQSSIQMVDALLPSYMDYIQPIRAQIDSMQITYFVEDKEAVDSIQYHR